MKSWYRDREGAYINLVARVPTSDTVLLLLRLRLATRHLGNF